MNVDIYVSNKFNKSIDIVKIVSNDKRFVIENTKKKILKNSTNIKISNIIFNASKVVSHKNFMVDLKKQTKFSASINKEDIDNYEWRYALYDTLKEKKQLKITGQFTLYTNLLPKIQFNGSCVLKLPKLLKEKILDFGIVKIGRKNKKFIYLKNPSDKVVFYSILLGKKYGKIKPIYFSVPNYKLNKIFKIQPHSKVKIGPIVYKPSKTLKRLETLLYIKNNLTIFESIRLYGASGKKSIKIIDQSSKKVFTNHIIYWNITHKEIGYWDFKTKKFLPNRDSLGFISFNKKLVIQNNGNLPILIKKTKLFGYDGCNVNGVIISKCFKNKRISPGEKIDIIIKYEPDFITSKLIVNLKFIMNYKYLDWDIIISLPHELLPYLYAQQPLTKYEKVFLSTSMYLLVLSAIIVSFLIWRDFLNLNIKDEFNLPITINHILGSPKVYIPNNHVPEVVSNPIVPDKDKKKIKKVKKIKKKNINNITTPLEEVQKNVNNAYTESPNENTENLKIEMKENLKEPEIQEINIVNKEPIILSDSDTDEISEIDDDKIENVNNEKKEDEKEEFASELEENNALNIDENFLKQEFSQSEEEEEEMPEWYDQEIKKTIFKKTYTTKDTILTENQTNVLNRLTQAFQPNFSRKYSLFNNESPVTSDDEFEHFQQENQSQSFFSYVPFSKNEKKPKKKIFKEIDDFEENKNKLEKNINDLENSINEIQKKIESDEKKISDFDEKNNYDSSDEDSEASFLTSDYYYELIKKEDSEFNEDHVQETIELDLDDEREEFDFNKYSKNLI
jgi:hypothetical protein